MVVDSRSAAEPVLGVFLIFDIPALSRVPTLGWLFDQLVGAARATSAFRAGEHLLAASSKCFNASVRVALVNDLQTYVGLKIASSFCLL